MTTVISHALHFQNRGVKGGPGNDERPHAVALHDLKQEDLRLFDNGVRTEIEHLWREL